MKLRENLNSALETVSKNFIHYYAKRDDSNDTIVFMHVEGIALCRIYWFHDDNTTVYLDWMSVSEEHRKNGLGLFMQEMRENIARKMGATKTMLWDRDWETNKFCKEQYPLRA